MKPDFLSTLFKRTRWFLRIRKIFDKLSRLTIRELSPQYGRKNLVTTIFFEQSIREKLNTRFDYYFWECCLLYFLESNVFVVLNPYYLQIQELFYIKYHKTFVFSIFTSDLLLGISRKRIKACYVKYLTCLGLL